MANLFDNYASSVDHDSISHEELVIRSKLLDAIELQLAAVFHGDLSAQELAQDMVDTFAASEHMNYFSQERLMSTYPHLRRVK